MIVGNIIVVFIQISVFSLCPRGIVSLYFAVFRKDRGSRGGGVLFLRENLNRVVVPVGDTDVEILCIDVSVKNFCSRLILVYLSGTEGYAADQSAMHSATSLLEELLGTEQPVIIMGDFNCPNIDWRNNICLPCCHPKERTLLDFSILNGLSQRVTRATRPSSSNILDLVFCTDDLLSDLCVEVVGNPVVSDHHAVIIDVHHATPASCSDSPVSLRYDSSNSDFVPINASLLATDWRRFFSGSNDANEMHENLFNYLWFLIHCHVPMKHDPLPRSIHGAARRLERRIQKCDLNDTDKLNTLQKKLARCLTRRRRLLETKIANSKDSSRFYGCVINDEDARRPVRSC